MAKSTQLCWLLGIALWPCTAFADTVRESAREIPVAAEVDVVVVGAAAGAVAAAVEADKKGAKVLLVAPRNYLGDDLCATLRLWLEEDEKPGGDLAEAFFGDRRTTTPLKVKQVLERTLLDANIDFLLGCYATDILVDGDGKPAGIVMANRAGRQAVVARQIIDATQLGVVGLLAGAQRQRQEGKGTTVRRVVLGGAATSTIEPLRSIPSGIEYQGVELLYHEYELELDLGDGDMAALAEAEQGIRDLTYREGQLRAAEHFTGAQPLAVGEFQVPEERIQIFGPARQRSALLSESQAWVSGSFAGDHAIRMPLPENVTVRSRFESQDRAGDTREFLAGLRSAGAAEKTIPSPEQGVPVLAEVDVVVVGGGTSGACAAIGAARRGADVLVVEFQEGLGGVGTVGLIGKPYHGEDRGFTKEVPFPDKKQNTEYKMEWFRREIINAGGQVWFGVLGCGAFVDGNRVRGAVVATPQGRGVVLADVVIDATGNGDVAVAAGAESMYGDGPHDIALQGTGLPRRPLGKDYVNTDYLLVDESDVRDTWRALVGTRMTVEGDPYDMGTFIQTRERRRIVGDHLLAYLDQIVGRTYYDSIVLSGSDYDSHGYPSEPYFALIPHTEKTLKANHPAPGGTCFTPYRCLLPQGLEGILVIGLAISMDRDASAMVRMQKDMHNQGYAAGVAAAMAVESQCVPREIDVKALQQHLVEIGNLPQQVLTDRDSYPLSQEDVDAAVADVVDEQESRKARCRALAVILSHSDLAVATVKRFFRTAQGEARLTYAKILGFLGEADGVDLLIETLEQVDSWDAKIFQGAMAEYAHLPTPVDALILALGYSGDRRAVPALLDKLKMLDAEVTLSHHRAVALALEAFGDPASAQPLARLLEKPGMGGHVMRELEPLHDRAREKRRRTGPLREIVLARALYRCGDHEGLGERILREYQSDWRGLFARHAADVLAGE
jgi:FAD-dependent oxidoreductase family protein/PBS lyase HEAT-like repeat-containing protein